MPRRARAGDGGGQRGPGVPHEAAGEGIDRGRGQQAAEGEYPAKGRVHSKLIAIKF